MHDGKIEGVIHCYFCVINSSKILYEEKVAQPDMRWKDRDFSAFS